MKTSLLKFTNPLNPRYPAKICGFYVITSKRINQTARDYLKGLGLPNVEVLDIDDLIYVIEKFTK